MTGKIRKLNYDFGEYIIEETKGSDQWPSGDPVPRDKETLAVFLHRKNYEIESTCAPATEM